MYSSTSDGVDLGACGRRSSIRGLFKVALLLTFLVGCQSFSPQQLASTVTVSEALEDIGQGFNEMSKALGEEKLGLFPCKLTVELNVAAHATEIGKLAVAATRLEGSVAEAKSEAKRDNKITVELYAPACLPTGTLGHDKPEQLQKALAGMTISEELAQAIITLMNTFTNTETTGVLNSEAPKQD